MRLMRLYAVEGRTRSPRPRRRSVSLVAGVLTVIPLAAIGDLLWSLSDPSNLTIHDNAGGTLVLRQ
jgi:uncharacterized RDD family membrane protein YckC